MSDNREVQSVIALYRGSDCEPLSLTDGTLTIDGQAYADCRVRYNTDEEMFLLIPIEQVPSIVKELTDCVFRHNAKVR